MIVIGILSYGGLIYLIYRRKKSEEKKDYYFGIYIFFAIIGFEIVKDLYQEATYTKNKKEIAILFYPLFFISIAYMSSVLKEMYSKFMKDLEKNKKLGLFVFEIFMFIVLIVIFVSKTDMNMHTLYVSNGYWEMYQQLNEKIYRMFINENVLYMFFFGTLIASHFSLMKEEKQSKETIKNDL